MKSLSLSQPHALIMVGAPGSGKSAFAEKFSHMFNAPHVDLDHILPHAENTSSADSLLMLQLEQLVKTKATLVLDANATTRTRRAELVQFFTDKGYQPQLVWVQTDLETSRQRVKRAKQQSDSDFEARLKQFNAPIQKEDPIVISGKHTYASQAKIVLKKLSAERVEISQQMATSPRSGRIRVL